MKFFNLILIINLFLNCTSNNAQPKTNFCDMEVIINSNEKYSTYILSIDKKLGELVALYPLENNNNFCYLYSNATIFVDSALILLSDNKYSLQQKLIANYSMQNLKHDEYIRYFDGLVDLFEKNNINEKILRESIFSQFAPNNIIIENYHNEKVKHILEKLRRFKISNNLKLDIDKILSGSVVPPAR